MQEHRYWFPAKRYGWGWGPPTVWQGWLVMLIWIAAVAAGTWVCFDSLWIFIPFILAMAGILIAIGYWKGEPPRWRWG